MKYVTLLLQVGVLYVFSLVGTWIQGVFHLSMPGSLIGMLILFLLLSTRVLPLKWFELGAEKLIVFLPLFLIPSTTGLMEYGSFLFSKESIIFPLVVASTVVTLIVSGYISQLLITTKIKSTRCTIQMVLIIITVAIYFLATKLYKIYVCIYVTGVNSYGNYDLFIFHFGISHHEYRENGGDILSSLLSPCNCRLAIPLFKERKILMKNFYRYLLE